MRLKIAAAVAAIVVSGHVVAAQTQINTTTVWDGSRQIGMFGAAPGNTVFGQSFTTPTTDHVLNSFSFWLNQGGGWQPDILFNAYVMAWDGAEAVGPVLYESATQAGPTTTMQEYTFDVGSFSLTPGSQYIAFFSTIGQLGNFPSDAQVLMGYSLNPYAGGRFYDMSNVTNFDDVRTQAWGIDAGGDYDAAFIANFSPPVTATPEPNTLVLVATGFAGICALGLRRRTSTTNR